MRFAPQSPAVWSGRPPTLRAVTACLAPCVLFVDLLPIQIPNEPCPNYLEAGDMNKTDWKAIGMTRLEDAARRLGCHVETMRIRVRDGRLAAVRGPHGAYYVAANDLAKLPVPRRGWPPRGSFTRREIEGSWDLVEVILSPTKEWANRERALIAELRANPAMNPKLYRLVSVHRLRRLGLAFEDIADELGISPRHARRLFRRRVFIALRRQLTKEDRAVAKRDRELAWRESRLERRGRFGRRRRWR